MMRSSTAALFVAGFLAVVGHRANAEGVVCSNTSFQGDNGYLATYQDVDARRLYRCPAGATTLTFIYAGTTAFGEPVQEVPKQSDEHLTIAVETGLGVPSPSGPALAMTALSRPKIPVLCGGQPACTIPAGGLLKTDPVRVHVPRGGIIAIDEHFTHSQTANGPLQPTYGGSLQIWGPSLPDFTRASSTPTPRNAAPDMGPQAIVGTPLAPTLSACIIGDLRAVGLAGAGLGYASLASGGTGFTTADVGQVMQNVSSGASADDTSTPASYVIRWRRQRCGHVIFGVERRSLCGRRRGRQCNTNGIETTRPTGSVHGTGFTVSVSADHFSTSQGVSTIPPRLPRATSRRVLRTETFLRHRYPGQQIG